MTAEKNTAPTESTVEASKAPEKKTPKALDFPPQDSVKASRQGTKVSILVDLLSREGGASLAEVAEASSYLLPASKVTVVVREKPWGTHYKLKA